MPGRGRFVAGDPIRGMGALAVFVIHCAGVAGVGVGLLNHGVLGVFGHLPVRIILSFRISVDFFFALSGYLIGRPFIAAFIDGRPLPPLVRYAQNRLRRVGPVMLVAFALSLLAFGTRQTDALHIAAVPLMVQTFFPSLFSDSAVAHFWTLDTEMAFYVLIVPGTIALMALTPRSWGAPARRRVVIGALLLLGAASLAISFRSPSSDLWTPYQFHHEAWGFVPGLICAALSTALPGRVAGSGRAARLATALALLSFIPYAGYVLTVQSSVGLRSVAGFLASALVVGGALLREWSTGRSWRVLDNRPLHWIGERSYSFYLLHVLVLAELTVPLHRSGGPTGFVINMLVGFPIAALVGELGYRLLERPFLARKRREPQPSPAVALAEA